MRNFIKLSLTALTAAFLLASLVGMASARNLSSTSQTLRATWASLEFSAAGSVIRCRVTLEGTFHSRTIAKVARALIGSITTATVAHPCTGGEGWSDNGVEATPGGRINRLPFHVTYEGFSGTLPNITLLFLLLSRVSFVIQQGINCTGRYGNATDNISGRAVREAGGGITTLTPVLERDRASLVTRIGGIFCPASGTFSGSGEVTVLGSSSRITITLI